MLRQNYTYDIRNMIHNGGTQSTLCIDVGTLTGLVLVLFPIYVIILCLFPCAMDLTLCVLCCSVAFPSATSCVDDLDENRSLQLKNLLSEYFDKRRNRDHTLQPIDLDELDKYKVKHTHNGSFYSISIREYSDLCLGVLVYFAAAGLGESD